MPRAILLVLLLAGCAREPGPPPVVDTYQPAGDDGLAVSFQRPVSWSLRTADQDGARFVLLEATPRERVVLSRLADAGETPLAELDQRVRSRIARQFPETESGPPVAAVLGGRAAWRSDFRLPRAGTRGVRYVVTGGYVIETEARERHAATVQPVFDRVLSSLTFLE